MTLFTGYSAEELIGRKSDCLIFPEDREKVKWNAREALSGAQRAPYKFRILTKEKKTRWVMEMVLPTLFKGRPAILGDFIDISDLKAVENRLKESETLYRAIFETTGTATIIVEEDMTISLLNSEFERMTGYREEWEGKKKWPEYIPKYELPRMKRTHFLRRLDPKAAPRNFEHDLLDSQENTRRMYLTVDMIPGTKKSVNSFTDITAWKEAERALKKEGEGIKGKVP